MTVDVLVIAMGISIILALAVCRIAVYLGFPVTPKNNRLGNLDGLRGFVAFAVLFHHFVRWINIIEFKKPWMPPKTIFFNNLGKGGVAIFFMITGAVFYPRVIAGLNHVDWRKLYISRLFRIIPLSIIVTAISAVVSLGFAAPDDLSALKASRNLLTWITGFEETPLFGYQFSARLNAGVMWSLWYEWLFYFALLPAMAALSMSLRRVNLPLGMGPALLLLFPIVLRLAGIHSDNLTFLILFALGMIVSELIIFEKLRNIISKHIISLIVLSSLFGAMYFIAGQYSPQILFVYFLLIITVASGNSMFGIISSDAARALGDISFGIYMLHGFVLSATVPAFALNGQIRPFIALPVAAAVTVVLAIASYLLIERPMIKIGQRIAGTRRDDRSLAVEVAP